MLLVGMEVNIDVVEGASGEGGEVLVAEVDGVVGDVVIVVVDGEDGPPVVAAAVDDEDPLGEGGRGRRRKVTPKEEMAERMEAGRY